MEEPQTIRDTYIAYLLEQIKEEQEAMNSAIEMGHYSIAHSFSEAITLKLRQLALSKDNEKYTAD